MKVTISSRAVKAVWQEVPIHPEMMCEQVLVHWEIAQQAAVSLPSIPAGTDTAGPELQVTLAVPPRTQPGQNPTPHAGMKPAMV